MILASLNYLMTNIFLSQREELSQTELTITNDACITYSDRIPKQEFDDILKHRNNNMIEFGKQHPNICFYKIMKLNIAKCTVDTSYLPTICNLEITDNSKFNACFSIFILNPESNSAIRIRNSTATFENCHFSNAQNFAICIDHSSVSFKNCIFYNNTGSCLAENNSNANFTDCIFENNKKAISASNSNIKLTKATIKDEMPIHLINSEGYFYECDLSMIKKAILISGNKSNPVFVGCRFSDIKSNFGFICENKCRPLFLNCNFSKFNSSCFSVSRNSELYIQNCDLKEINEYYFCIFYGAKVIHYNINKGEDISTKNQISKNSKCKKKEIGIITYKELVRPIDVIKDEEEYHEIIVSDNCCRCNKKINDFNQNLDSNVSFKYCQYDHTFCEDCCKNIFVCPICRTPLTFYSRLDLHNEIVHYHHTNHNPITRQGVFDKLKNIPSEELRIQVYLLKRFFNDSVYIEYLTKAKETLFDQCIEFRDLYISICLSDQLTCDVNNTQSFDTLFLNQINNCKYKFIDRYELDECSIKWLFYELKLVGQPIKLYRELIKKIRKSSTRYTDISITFMKNNFMSFETDMRESIINKKAPLDLPKFLESLFCTYQVLYSMLSEIKNIKDIKDDEKIKKIKNIGNIDDIKKIKKECHDNYIDAIIKNIFSKLNDLYNDLHSNRNIFNYNVNWEINQLISMHDDCLNMTRDPFS